MDGTVWIHPNPGGGTEDGGEKTVEDVGDGAKGKELGGLINPNEEKAGRAPDIPANSNGLVAMGVGVGNPLRSAMV